MLTIALDTCDRRGSVALVRDGGLLQAVVHEGDEDYSAWLLPAVGRALDSAGVTMAEVDAYVAASGPGSFTGVRVGLTTVKAWGEVYGRPVLPVSRLLALGMQAETRAEYVASFADAQRGQIFGGLFRRDERGHLAAVGEEMVITADAFVDWVAEKTGSSLAAWVGLDPEKIAEAGRWQARASRGEKIQQADAVVAPWLATVGEARVKSGSRVDPLNVDANYVRRSDAEIFWKGKGQSGR